MRCLIWLALLLASLCSDIAAAVELAIAGELLVSIYPSLCQTSALAVSKTPKSPQMFRTWITEIADSTFEADPSGYVAYCL